MNCCSKISRTVFVIFVSCLYHGNLFSDVIISFGLGTSASFLSKTDFLISYYYVCTFVSVILLCRLCCFNTLIFLFCICWSSGFSAEKGIKRCSDSACFWNENHTSHGINSVTNVECNVVKLQQA